MTKCFLSSVGNFHLLFTVATRSQDLSDCLFVLSRISCLIFQNINNVTMTSMTSTLTILQYIFTICQQQNNKILVKVGLACHYCPPSPPHHHQDKTLFPGWLSHFWGLVWLSFQRHMVSASPQDCNISHHNARSIKTEPCSNIKILLQRSYNWHSIIWISLTLNWW